MKYRRRVNIATGSHANLKICLLLAMIPVLIVAAIYIYGNSNFDSSTTGENDAVLEDDPIESYKIDENKSDFAREINRKMELPTPKIVEKSFTTKADKRLIGSNGGILTIELQQGQTLESLAEKKFGNKVFWVYFFDVNRDKLNKPSDAKGGMKLYVPNPDFYGFSANDKGSIQYAQHRAEEILSDKQ